MMSCAVGDKDGPACAPQRDDSPEDRDEIAPQAYRGLILGPGEASDAVWPSRGRETRNVVPSSSDTVKWTVPPRYRSVNSFMLYVPIPLPEPFVENERWNI